MRKSIKKIAASLFAATMVFGSCVSAFADDAAPTVLDTIEEGQTIYTIGSAMTQPDAWAPESLNNVMTETEYPGVYSLNIKVPALTKEVTDETTGETTTEDTGIWEHRFSICAYDYDVESTWNRVILGVPSVKPSDVSKAGANNLTAIRVTLTDKERDVTVYFDSATYAIAMAATDGEPVDYTIGWMTYDDTENYLTPEELSAMSFADFKAQLVEAPRGTELDNYGVTEVPDFVKLEADLVAKLNAEPEQPTEAPTEAPTQAPTQAPTEAPTQATQATQAPTTASNQSTKTGDVAPVALMVVLFAAVAVVAVAAKKKEA